MMLVPEIFEMQKPKHRQIDSTTILNATYTMKPPLTTTIYSSMASTTRPSSSSSFLHNHKSDTGVSPSQKKKIKNDKKMEKSSSVLWDCDSSLYDSYELKSFKQHLDSAINSRSLSMPHLHRRTPPPPPPPEHLPPPRKTSSRFSRSFTRLFRSLFRRKPKREPESEIVDSDSGNVFEEGECCDISGCSLWTIPEVPETYVQFSPPSPELKSVSRRAVSDRFSKFSSIQHRF